MSRSAFGLVRLFGLVAAAALAVGALPALAQTAPSATSGECSGMRFQLSNPDPGAALTPGAYVVQGVAQDARATQGSGIDRVDFFLDSREQGGTNLGSVLPDETPGPFGPDSFQTVVTLPDIIGGHALFAYARSHVNGAESVIGIPIAIGETPDKAFATTPDTTVQMCVTGSGGGAPTPPSTTAPAPSTTTAQPSTPTTTTTTTGRPNPSTIVFQVGNPSPGDTIHEGGLIIEGIAMDTAAQQGSGIDRIQIFLDSRDAGGMVLGFGSISNGDKWTATISMPSNQAGLHTLFFYAHSLVSGDESVVSVHVTVIP
jgi:hypothetical protein